jgi:hypothetical protein
MVPPTRNVSVILPVGQAIDRAKLLLFQPFDPGKWFIIGFCAWLAYLGEGGFGGNFNFNGPGGGGRGGGGLREWLEQARDFVMNNLHWIVPVALAVIALSLALGVLLTWLSSRGKFMFLHCVALNRAEVAAPWNKYRNEANSLFVFRLVLGLLSLVPTLPLIVGILLVLLRIAGGRGTSPGPIVLLIGLVLVFALIVFALWLVAKLTTDFVVPLMYLRGARCVDAWKEFYGLLAANPGNFVLYLLFQIVLSLAIGVLVITAVLVTCCIAGCFLMIPYLGTVLMLPVLVFSRAYSLHYLAQFAPEYDTFARG